MYSDPRVAHALARRGLTELSSPAATQRKMSEAASRIAQMPACRLARRRTPVNHSCATSAGVRPSVQGTGIQKASRAPGVRRPVLSTGTVSTSSTCQNGWLIQVENYIKKYRKCLHSVLARCPHCTRETAYCRIRPSHCRLVVSRQVFSPGCR